MAGADRETPALPLGCSLQGSDAVERVAAWRELLGGALIDRAATPQGIMLRLARRPGLEAGIVALVERERDCCSSLGFHLAVDGDELVLEIAGTPEAAPSVRVVFAAGPPARRR